MTGEPARGPRGEGVGTEEIPGTEIGKEELEGNRRVASGRAQLPKGWWLWRSVWWHLVVFSELPKLEMKDLLLLSAAQICVWSSVTKGRCGPARQDQATARTSTCKALFTSKTRKAGQAAVSPHFSLPPASSQPSLPSSRVPGAQPQLQNSPSWIPPPTKLVERL